MSKLCIQCVHCARQPNGESLCTKIVLSTSLVDGNSVHWQCEDERSKRGACGPDALNYDSLAEAEEKYQKEKDEKRRAYIKSLSPWKRFLYLAMIN